jgi:hypothetical protein
MKLEWRNSPLSLTCRHLWRNAKHTCHLACLFVVAVGCSGCIPIPYRAVVRPGVNGVIFDAQTGQPILGAKVMLDSTNYYMANPTRHQLASLSLESTTNGDFNIPPHRKWRLELTPNFAPNDGAVECHVQITHAGYEPYRLNFGLPDASLFWPMPPTTNLSKIFLQPLRQ